MGRQAFFEALAGRGCAPFFEGFWPVYILMLAFGFWTVALMRAPRRVGGEHQPQFAVALLAGSGLVPLSAAAVVSVWPHALLRLVGGGTLYQLSPHGVTHILDSLRCLVCVDGLAGIAMAVALLVAFGGDRLGARARENPAGAAATMQDRALRKTKLTDLGLEWLGVPQLCEGDAATGQEPTPGADVADASHVPKTCEEGGRGAYEDHGAVPRCKLTIENPLTVKRILVDGKPWSVRRVQSTEIQSAHLMFSRDGRSIWTQEMPPEAERDHSAVVYDPESCTWSALVEEERQAGERTVHVLTSGLGHGRRVALGRAPRFEVAGLIFNLALAGETD